MRGRINISYIIYSASKLQTTTFFTTCYEVALLWGHLHICYAQKLWQIIKSSARGGSTKDSFKSPYNKYLCWFWK